MEDDTRSTAKAYAEIEQMLAPYGQIEQFMTRAPRLDAPVSPQPCVVADALCTLRDLRLRNLDVTGTLSAAIFAGAFVKLSYLG